MSVQSLLEMFSIYYLHIQWKLLPFAWHLAELANARLDDTLIALQNAKSLARKAILRPLAAIVLRSRGRTCRLVHSTSGIALYPFVCAPFLSRLDVVCLCSW